METSPAASNKTQDALNDKDEEKQQKNELSPPLLSISLEYFLQLSCRSFDGYAVIPIYLAEEIKKIDPTEQFHHLEEYGNPLLLKLYPIEIWRRDYQKILKDRERSEKERQDRFIEKDKVEANKSLIQRKRDIIAEANADVKKKYPNILLVVGKGLQTWNQQQEMLEYLLFRALNGENEAMRCKFGIEKELCEEFQLLPADPGWRNKYYQGDIDLL